MLYFIFTFAFSNRIPTGQSFTVSSCALRILSFGTSASTRMSAASSVIVPTSSDLMASTLISRFLSLNRIFCMVSAKIVA